MAQYVKAITGKPGNLSLIPRTHIVEEEASRFYEVVLDLHMCTLACSSMCAHMQHIYF